MFANITITYLQAGALLASFFLLSRIVRALSDPLRAIPGPFTARFTSLWYFYHLRSGKSHWAEVDLHRRYGSIVRLTPTQYSVDSLDAAKQLYGHGTNARKSDWYRPWASTIVDPHGFRDLFSIQDPKFHLEQRKVVSNLYSMTNLLQMEDCVDETAALLFKAFDNFCENGRAIDLNHWMRCYALDVVIFITLNKRFGVLDRDGDDEGLFKHFTAQAEVSTLAGVYPALFSQLIKLVVSLPIKPPLDPILKFVEQQLEEYALTHDNKDDSSDIELDQRSVIHRGTMFYSRDPAKFPKSALKTVALMNIFAGTDTTSIVLAATLHFLSSFPRMLEKLRKEIREAKANLGIGDQSFPYQQAQKLPYLQAVIKESMRLYSPVGMSMPRVVPSNGVTLVGRYFPGGTEVGINPWVAHRNPDVFGTSADEFRPERWLLEGPDSAERMSNMESYLLYFGQGSRTCIGKNISLLEISKVLPEIVLRYDFEFTDPDLKRDTQRGVKTTGAWFVQQSNLQCKVKRATTNI